MNAKVNRTTKTDLLAGERLQSLPVGRSRLKAVVLYDEFESGVRAKTLLGQATKQAVWTGELESVFWRFDVMTQPLVAREALYRAADADIVLMVSERTAHPPDSLIEWLEIWAIIRRIQDALLAAWCHQPHAGERLSEGAEALRNLAGRYGLDWLCAEELARKAA